MEKFIVHVHTQIDNPPYFEQKSKDNHQFWIYTDKKYALHYIHQKLNSYPMTISKSSFYERKAYLKSIELYSLIDTFEYQVSTGTQEVEPVTI